MNALPEPEVVSCYFDEGFAPRLAAMCLRWSAEIPERVWELPEGLRLFGPPPVRFGLSVLRQEENGYAVGLVWNQTAVNWTCLTRQQLADSDLKRLLAAMGTDLLYILEQPILNRNVMQLRAA